MLLEKFSALEPPAIIWYGSLRRSPSFIRSLDHSPPLLSLPPLFSSVQSLPSFFSVHRSFLRLVPPSLLCFSVFCFWFLFFHFFISSSPFLFLLFLFLALFLLSFCLSSFPLPPSLPSFLFFSFSLIFSCFFFHFLSSFFSYFPSLTCIPTSYFFLSFILSSFLSLCPVVLPPLFLHPIFLNPSILPFPLLILVCGSLLSHPGFSTSSSCSLFFGLV